MSTNDASQPPSDSGPDLSSIAGSTGASVVAVRPAPDPDRGPAPRDRRRRHGRRGRWGRGRAATGFVVADGAILTTAHNARSSVVEVTFHDGRTVTGTVRAADHDRDLAIIAADTGDIPVLPIPADAPGLSIGTAVVAASAPTGVLRVTSGEVAAVGSRLRTATGSPVGNIIEHTAPMPPGASGGPVLDRSGSLVGINANRLSGGLYQAIPADAALRSVVEALIAGTVPARRRLGIVVTDPRQAAAMREAVGLAPRQGVLIAEVLDDGPASAAGLSAGDLIETVDGRAIGRPDELLLALDAAAGDTVSLTVSRGEADARTVDVELSTASAEPTSTD